MASLLSRLRSGPPREGRSVLDVFTFNGMQYGLGIGNSPVLTTMQGQQVSDPPSTLPGLAREVLAANGPVAALIFVRQMVFSTVEFKFQRLSTRELFGDPSLRLLEEPWPGATTQNLLSKTLVDADLTGNAYWTRMDGELVRLRPDWVQVVFGVRPNGTLRKSGYRYHEGGIGQGGPQIDLDAADVAHFMPLQDPEQPWRGMSWLSPVLREVVVDKAASTHQQRFFENAATPNLAVTFDPSVSRESVQQFKQVMEDRHKGAHNAYETLYLGGGADVTVVGTDLSKLGLKDVQGGLETRLAAAAGVPPVVVGFREGMQGSSLNAGNYAQARRRFSDGTLDPLWREAAGSFARLVRPPSGARLWFDTRHVPFLREDAKDAAEITQIRAATVRTTVEAGYDPDAAAQFAESGDPKVLLGQHTGLTSAQLREPLAGGKPDPDDPDAVASQVQADLESKGVDKDLVNAAGILIRSGFEAVDVLDKLGIPAIAHTGLLPVTLKTDDDTPPQQAEETDDE